MALIDESMMLNAEEVAVVRRRMTAREDAYQELVVAQLKFPPMVSAHEGYAILQEEVEELWEEVRKKPADRSRERLYQEAKQIAAMAMRFMIDVASKEK